MERNKSQSLWYLLNRFDRENDSILSEVMKDQEDHPFFYLLNWNNQLNTSDLRKTALRSPIRAQFYQLNHDAPKIDFPINQHTNQTDLINDFLEKLPTLTKPKKGIGLEEDTLPVDLADTPWSPPISETFAIILVKQQKYQEAIEIYEQLILAKPEKRLYFATRISELQQNITE